MTPKSSIVVVDAKPMKIFVTVKPGAKREEIKSADGTHMTVWVKARAHEGMANDAVVSALADYFGVVASRVRMVSGRSSRRKIFDILQ